MRRDTWIHYTCPRCGEDSLWGRGDGEAGEGRLRCSRCEFTFPRSSRSLDRAQPLHQCALCGGREFYTQKDFNRKLGLAIVAGTAGVGFLMMLLFDLWGLLILAVVTAADFLIYHRLPEVSVCYLCQSVYHGFPPHPEQRAFYLANEERFKALRQSWLEELRL